MALELQATSSILWCAEYIAGIKALEGVCRDVALQNLRKGGITEVACVSLETAVSETCGPSELSVVTAS